MNALRVPVLDEDEAVPANDPMPSPKPTIRFLTYVPAGIHYLQWDGGPGLTVFLPVLATLQSFSQPAGGDEACGILIGRQFQNGDVILCGASSPGPLDVREPRRCIRRDPCHQQLVEAAWDATRDQHFAGSWHTHAQPVPEASEQDVVEWIDEARSAKTQQGDAFRVLFVIVGQTHIGIWEYVDGT